MRSKVVVFDFDGTIIKEDSFYSIISKFKNKKSLYKRLIAKLILLLYSKKIINNTLFKKLITSVILKNFYKNDLENIAIEFAKETVVKDYVNLDILENFIKHLKEENTEVIILSASPSDIVRPILSYLIINNYKKQEILKKIKFLCSELIYKNEKIYSFGKNLYQAEKRKLLESLGIYRIDTLYTDSYDDLPLVEIADKTYLVKDGHIVNINKRRGK